MMLLNCGAREDLDSKRSSQSILREINPECLLEGLMLKLELQHLVIRWKQMTHWKSPDAGKD